jgi:hypothetical protein
MAPFKRFLTSRDVEDVRAFLLWQAHQPEPTAAPVAAHAQ